MADLLDLERQLTELRAHRASGVASLSYGGKEVAYKTDTQMAEAIADLEQQIAGLRGQRISVVRFSCGKGL